MALDTATLDHLARLARLALGAEERDRLAIELGRTLEMAEALQRIDVGNAAPLASPNLTRAEPRADVVTESNVGEALLALSGESQGGYFLVPKVIE
jgi:aspartyl-tRNA(Asn)/glutamyl-tRNA(Gln) amidotransferase subunit C